MLSDGYHIVTTSVDGSHKLWNLLTGKGTNTLEMDSDKRQSLYKKEICRLEVSEEQGEVSMAVCGYNNGVSVWMDIERCASHPPRSLSPYAHISLSSTFSVTACTPPTLHSDLFVSQSTLIDRQKTKEKINCR